MTSILRAFRALMPFALLLPVPALAQSNCSMQLGVDDAPPAYADPEDPWIYRGTDIPIDSQWLMGELPNGVRYAVRRNGVPPCQISMRVRIDAGSLHEEDSERGFAHLLEHMTFRQSRDFGPGEAIPYFQRLGASLGADTNAITSPTQTVYKLDLPNANRTTLGDSIRLFAGMIQEPVINGVNLAADLPIVLAERRDSAGAQRRIFDTLSSTMFAGQRLAERSPIGTLETLQGASAETVEAFHQRWYRPENTVVVLAGDADPRLLAALIEREFGGWQGEGPFVPAPDFGDPAPPANMLTGDGGVPVGKVSVLVEAGQPRTVSYAVVRPWVEVVDNIEYNRGILLDSLAAAIVNRRLENRARDGGSFLYARIQRSKQSRSVDATNIAFAPLTDDWEAALLDVRSVIADALTTAPSQAEIDRAVADFDVTFVNMVEQARIQAGSGLADDVVNAVDIREAVAAPATFLSVFRSMSDRFTPEAFLRHTQGLFEGVVIRGMMVTPDGQGASEAQLRAALSAPVVASSAARDDTQALNFADLPAIGTPAQPVSRELIGVFDTEVATFANGVRAMIFSRDNEPGRVTVRVRFGAGMRAIADDEAVYAELAQGALVNSGLGPLGQNDLDRLAAGRKLSFGFGIEEGTFVFAAQTRQEDLADQLYLFAAKFAQPRWDIAPFERARSAGQIAYDSYGSDPSGVVNRDLDWLLRDRDPRFATATPAMLAGASHERFREVWSRLLREGPIEVAVFGDVDREAAIAALGATFGALQPRPPISAEVINRPMRFPASNTVPLELIHGGDAEQAAAVIAWPTGAGSAGISESRKLDLLAQIYGNRLIDSLRETSGAAYSPIVRSTWPLDVNSGGMIFALVQIEPQLISTFFEEADAIAADLAANGPSADDFARVVEPAIQYIDRAQTGHGFWLNELDGAAFDPQRIFALRTLGSDFFDATPEEMRVLAQKYLLGHGGYRVAIVPAQGAASPAMQGR